ncbi:hypothetical protein SARC_08752 [Sphaeroforma arctica JP610]|uniref:LicD/FKTN/FKRP nucleotidyltransferase domain-containing protein n=1 Tax=Sphaeroforma arctica JP610 TaxID=667725 RepID=A0A0L0FPU8_9EUKA|nr:hypothetical protein SARC_08752 [Sphaeroforma arctica JP610]KNC78835.1 hypothetical protein SARC_08752 [Sphaeroforma arctica JP610]|eukprot:XP_014152737.1 hypothetical protein SARC_08752 [Sphaeroforma arctica JP610]
MFLANKKVSISKAVTGRSATSAVIYLVFKLAAFTICLGIVITVSLLATKKIEFPLVAMKETRLYSQEYYENESGDDVYQLKQHDHVQDMKHIQADRYGHLQFTNNNSSWARNNSTIRMQGRYFNKCPGLPTANQTLKPAPLMRYASPVYTKISAKKYNIRRYAGRFLRAMNDYGVIYYATSGTLLGVYRHRGQIPGDKDNDVEIPLRLNKRYIRDQIDIAVELTNGHNSGRGIVHQHRSHFDKSDEEQLASLKNNCSELYDETSDVVLRKGLMCGLNATQWSAILDSNFKAYFTSLGFGVTIKDAERNSAHYYIREPCRAKEDPSIRLDRTCFASDIVFVIDRNEKKSNDATQSKKAKQALIGRTSKSQDTRVDIENPCVCWFYNIPILCPSDSKDLLERDYGPDFMTPDRVLSEYRPNTRLDSGIRVEHVKHKKPESRLLSIRYNSRFNPYITGAYGDGEAAKYAVKVRADDSVTDQPMNK